MREEELIKELKSGSEEAFTALYHIYSAKVYNFSRLYIRSASEVEEIVQEVFCKLWESRELLKVGEDFNSYLFIITRNLIFNQYRKSFNEVNYKMMVISSASETYEIEEELETADLKILISKLISLLTPRQQEIFRLSREQHLSYKEISDRLGISEKTVEHHISNALKFIRQNISLYSLFVAF